MDYKEFYETNQDFRGYVDRYARHNGKTVEEALEHDLVKQYADYVLHKND